MRPNAIDKVVDRLQAEINERQKMIELLLVEHTKTPARKRGRPRAVAAPKEEQSA
jgi:hypothetical protein